MKRRLIIPRRVIMPIATSIHFLDAVCVGYDTHADYPSFRSGITALAAAGRPPA
jgi:hypothetical protein